MYREQELQWVFMVILVLTIPYIINVYKTIGIGASPNRAVITSQQSHNIDNPSPVINCSSLVVDLPKNVSMNIHPSCPRHYLYKDGKRCPPVTSPADFIGVDYPFYFYGYSAFLMADEGNPQIAIIIMRTATKQNFKLGCYIQFAGSEEYIHGNMGPVYLTMSRFDTNKFGQLYSGIIRCLYPAGMQRNKVAQNIRIYTGNTTLTTLPVEELAKPLKRKSLGLCLARTYQDPYCKDCRGINYTYHLPEWVEMQRMMGVDTIFVYNVSMNADASLIFNYYARQGFVEVLSHTPIHNETYMPVSMGITECIYRNRYAYDYILAIDMDEFIIPMKWNTYQEIIMDLLNQSSFHHIRFPGGHFLTDNRLANNHSQPYLKTMMYQRYNYTGFTKGGKSIMNPRKCMMATAHACSVKKETFDVDRGDALMHHYKGCSLRSSFWKQACQKSNNILMLTSNATDRFHVRLGQAVQGAFHDLKLWGY